MAKKPKPKGKPPAFQFYAADYLADANTEMMTEAEEGIYLRLMLHCWIQGSLPADEEMLQRLQKDKSKQVPTLVRQCFKFHPKDDTRLIHPRLEKEREKQREYSESRAASGVASGEARRKKREINDLQVEHTLNECSTHVERSTQRNRTLQSSSSSSSSKENTEIPTVSYGGASSAPSDPPVMTFPVIDRSEPWPLTADKLAEWEDLYPNLDVEHECRRARQWLLDNPKRGKKWAGMTRYLGNWIAGNAERAKPEVTPGNDQYGCATGYVCTAEALEATRGCDEEEAENQARRARLRAERYAAVEHLRPESLKNAQ